MTEDEKQELRDLLAEGVKERGFTPEKILTDKDGPLDEDSGQFYVTEHERIVFQLDPEVLPALLYAYDAYQDLIDTTVPSMMTGRCYDLIVKARSIHPEFQMRVCNERVFQWFTKEFFGISHRQAHSYYWKRSFNTWHIAVFKDEKTGPSSP